ncbi:MAG TPA: hypothetical protein PLP25_04365, partial [Candidatus Limiplasma sp.]|nr:hypothetical protein [Candidatus Limiplasma sp.]
MDLIGRHGSPTTANALAIGPNGFIGMPSATSRPRAKGVVNGYADRPIYGKMRRITKENGGITDEKQEKTILWLVVVAAAGTAHSLRARGR